MNGIKNNSLRKTHKEKGVALLTALIITLLLSITGIAISKYVTSAKRDATDFFDNTVSFVNAEIAIDNATAAILNNFTSGNLQDPTNNTNAILIEQNADPLWWMNEANWADPTFRSGTVTDDDGNNLPGTPTFIIERVGEDFQLDINAKALPTRVILNVTGTAQGNGDSRSFIQVQVAIIE